MLPILYMSIFLLEMVRQIQWVGCQIKLEYMFSGHDGLLESKFGNSLLTDNAKKNTIKSSVQKELSTIR